MKASARNHFTGTVSEVRLGAVNAEVHIGLQGGASLVASITKDSVETLDIKIGLEVVALVKAPQIIIVTDFGGYRLSARNQLAATLTNDSIEALGLCKGQSATAVFKAGAVILAVPG